MRSIALVVVLLATVSIASAQVPEGQSQTDPADGLLKRARRALGGDETFAGITSLLVEGTRTREPESEYAEQDPWGFKLILPDRYQSLASEFRHTIDAGAFWMDERGGDQSGAVYLSPQLRATAERATRWNFAHSCILFLLAPPKLFKAEFRYLGALSDDAAQREWLEVRADGFRFQVGFERATSLPRDIRTETNNGMTVESLYDFKTVDGVMLPFTINERSASYHSVVNITSIRVNSGVTVADFKKKQDLVAHCSCAQANAGNDVPVAAKPNFTGTWVLDVQRSWIAAPDREPLAAETLVVKQSESKIAFSLAPAGTTRSVPLGGERHETTGPDGLTYGVAAKWRNDGLVLTADTSGPSFVRFVISSWTLAADGDELTVIGTSHTRSTGTPNETVISDVKTRRVYRRQ